MKILQLPICLFFLINYSYAQIKPIDYGKPEKMPSVDQIMRTQAANRQARAASNAAEAEAMKSNYEKINLDKLLGEDQKYKYVVLAKISGWSTYDNRVEIFYQLTSSGKYSIVNPETPKRNYKTIPDSIQNNTKTIFLEWYRDAPNDNDRITHLVLKNSSGEVIFDADYKNKSYSEMLKPLMSNYTFTKEYALKKIKEYKELKDLGVISQEEYDQKVKQFKDILLD